MPTGVPTMLWGVALVGVGIAISYLSFLASEPGGEYWVFAGVIVAGIVTIIAGVIDFLGARAEADERLIR